MPECVRKRGVCVRGLPTGRGQRWGCSWACRAGGGPFHFSCVNKGPAFLSEAPSGLSSPRRHPLLEQGISLTVWGHQVVN